MCITAKITIHAQVGLFKEDLHAVNQNEKYLDEIFNPAMGVTLNVGLNPNERLDLSVQPVRHQLKLSIRWDKRDSSVILKPRETHTLMKLDIFKLNCF